MFNGSHQVGHCRLIVIGPNIRQLWLKGIQRAIGTILGLIVGYLLIQFIPNEMSLVMATAVLERIPAERVGIAIAVAAVFLIERILAKCKKN